MTLTQQLKELTLKMDAKFELIIATYALETIPSDFGKHLRF
jgi:hypothetical protein